MEKIENMADASTNDTNTTTIVPPPTIIKGKPVMNRPQTDKNTTADRITMHPRSGTVHRTTSESLRLGNGTTDPVIGQPQISPPAARPPMSKPTKTSSFQITSVTVGTRAMDNGEDSADDLDESHTDDNSRITDLENETPSFSEDTFSKEEVFFGQTALGSAPVIPTSAQYGLAIVAPDLVTGHPFGGPDVDGTGDGTVDGKKLDPIDGKDLHNRNERFKVVKIESTEPFKRGRWMCMDYLDHTTLQQQTPTASGTGTATIPPESKTTTLDSGVGMADGQLYINSDGLANDSPNKPMPPDMNIQNFVSHTMSQPGYSMSTTTSPGQSLLQSLPPPPIQSGYTVDGSIHSTTGATNVPPQPIHHIVGSDGSAPQPPNGLPVQQSHSMTSIPTGPTGATGPYVAGNQPGQPFYQSQISDGQTYHQTSAVTSQPSTATISPTVVQSTGQQMPVHSTMSNQPATVSGQIPTNIYPAPSQPQTLHTSIGHQPQMLSHVHDPTPPPATQQQQQPQPPQQMVGQSLPAANFISMNAQQPPHIPQSSAFHYQPTDGQPLSYGTGQSDDQFVGAANPYVPLQTTGTTVPNNGGQPFVITSTTDIVSPASQIASQIRGQMPQLFQQQQSVQDAMGDGAVAQLATPGDGEQRTAEDSENMDDPSTNRSHYDKNKSVRKRATPPSPIVQQFPAATFINLSPSRDVYTTLALGGTVHAAHQSIGDDPSIGIPIPQGRFSAAHQRMYSPPVSPTYAASPPYGRYLSVSLGSEPEGMRSRVQSPTPWTLTGGRQSPRGSISETSASAASTVAIDNKIEQAMDLVKSHLMFAVREEVEVLKEKIAELMDRINQLEKENTILKADATQETLTRLTTIQTTKSPSNPTNNGQTS